MHTIDNTLHELFDLQKFAIKLGLENISKLTAFFNNPHLTYPAIHIAGTNGKGSTAIILQKILMQHGLNVGLYTSPHLINFNERIRVNENLIENDFIIGFWNDVKSRALELKATFFDTTTCLAFEYFKHNKVDVAIFETGLGGRLDSTNIIDANTILITPIDFDHQKQLGNTLSKIAYEKAGIIKNNCSVFISKQKEEVNSYFKNHYHSDNINYFDAQIENLKIETNIDSTIFEFRDIINQLNFKNIKTNLLGYHQAENACLAYMAGINFLNKNKMDFNKGLFANSLLNVNWPGRLNKINSDPNIFLDVSHNVAGFITSIDFIQSNFSKSNSKLILGLLEDKDYKQIVNIVKDKFSKIWIVEPDNHRKLPGKILVNEFRLYNIDCIFIKDLSKSFDGLIDDLAQKDNLFIMGSHYLAEQITIQNIKIT